MSHSLPLKEPMTERIQRIVGHATIVSVMTLWAFGWVWVIGPRLAPLRRTHPGAYFVSVAVFSLAVTITSPMFAWLVFDRRREWWTA